LAIITVWQFPTREPFSRRVSFELRNGTCFRLSASALMQFPENQGA
jgi:hypothetical protein